MTNNANPQMWEFWHARFDYGGKKGYKYRPVIIVIKCEDDSLVRQYQRHNLFDQYNLRASEGRSVGHVQQS